MGQIGGQKRVGRACHSVHLPTCPTEALGRKPRSGRFTDPCEQMRS